MGQSLFKKHSKFQNSDELFYCGITRLRNTTWMFLHNVSTQELFEERVSLRNVQNF